MNLFSLNARIYFGIGCWHKLPELLKDHAFARIGVLIDKNIAGVPIVNDIIDSIDNSGLSVVFRYPVDTGFEPTYDYLDTVADDIRNHSIDVVVGIGGGSTLDVCKGVGILQRNPGKAISYRGMDKVASPGIASILLPTTAGTGSEVTATASFVDQNTKTKLGINGRFVAPLFGMLCPELVCSCPRSISVSSALDAMVHAVEAATAKPATEFSKALGCEAFKILYTNLPDSLNEADDLKLRESMLAGSCLAGMAMVNCGGGPASGISYPLGTQYNVPHGLAGGIFLPYVFTYNASSGYDGYADLLTNGADVGDTKSRLERSEAFAERFQQFYQRIDAPERLSDAGFTGIDCELLTDLTMRDRQYNLSVNPIHFGAKEVADILEKVV